MIDLYIPPFDEFWNSIGEDKMQQILQRHVKVFAGTESTTTNDSDPFIKTVTCSVAITRDILAEYHAWLASNIVSDNQAVDS